MQFCLVDINGQTYLLVWLDLRHQMGHSLLQDCWDLLSGVPTV